MMRAGFCMCLLAAALAIPVCGDDSEPASPRELVPETPISEEAIPVPDLSQIARSGITHLGRPGEALTTNDDETSRGVGQFVYADVAPAVVLIQTHYGHGTGFFIREDGWLLTNRHVVQDADYRLEEGGQIVQVNIGLLDDDGWMRVVDHPLPAMVYKTDPRRDLALVKLLEMPPGMTSVPVLEFSDDVPAPGSDCVAIGHPAAGTLWTLRSGELAGAGEFPRDQMDQIVYLLSVSAADREQFEEALVSDPERKQVFLSTCGLNPGDSGGPLVNEEGEVVAVSFAVPLIDPERSVDLGNFSFHVHLEEVRAFVEDWPSAPVLDAPTPFPAATYYELQDTDQDGYYDTLLMGEGPGYEPVGMLVDLDGDSFGGRSVKQIEKSGEYLFIQDFDFEFCVAVFPRMRISYDTDNDGRIDLVVSDEDHDEQPELEIVSVDGAWEMQPLRGEPVSAERFESKALRKRFTTLQSGAAVPQ